MISNIEHLFMRLMAICISSLGKCLFGSYAHFLIGLLGFLMLSYMSWELTLWKRPWCWESLKARGEGDKRGWNSWLVSPTQWTWVWASSRSWWRTGKLGVLQSMGLQRVGHDWVNWTESFIIHFICKYFIPFSRLSFHLVDGFLCYAKTFKFN